MVAGLVFDPKPQPLQADNGQNRPVCTGERSKQEPSRSSAGPTANGYPMCKGTHDLNGLGISTKLQLRYAQNPDFVITCWLWVNRPALRTTKNMKRNDTSPKEGSRPIRSLKSIVSELSLVMPVLALRAGSHFPGEWAHGKVHVEQDPNFDRLSSNL